MLTLTQFNITIPSNSIEFIHTITFGPHSLAKNRYFVIIPVLQTEKQRLRNLPKIM